MSKKEKKGLFDLFSKIKHTSSDEKKKEKKEKKEKDKKDKKEKKDKKDKKDKKEPAPTPASPQKVDAKASGYSNNSMVNLMKNMPDWRDTTRKVMDTGNFETFPIAGDLPRLLKHLNIVRKNGDDIECLFPEGSNSTGKVKIIKDTQGTKIVTGDCLKVILCITKIFDEKHCEKVEKEWNAVMDNNEDLSVQKTFLMRVLKSVYMEEGSSEVSPVITFLKAINQKIIASPTMKLKGVCGNMFIKDAQPMVWEIAVILDGEQSIISHYRRQETTSKNPEEYFRFLWEIRMIFNKDMTQLQELKMGINEIEFLPETALSVREKVESTLEELKFEDCVVQDLEDDSDDEE